MQTRVDHVERGCLLFILSMNLGVYLGYVFIRGNTVLILASLTETNLCFNMTG